MTDVQSPALDEAQLWDPPHVRYTLIAYGWSWLLWIGAWVLAVVVDTGDVLFNQDFVWQVLFDGDVDVDLLVVSLIGLAAAWGPMVAGMIMSRRDPAIPTGDLGRRIRRVQVAPRYWVTALVVLAIVVVPPLLFSVFAMDTADTAPGFGTLLAFLGAFFVVQVLTSGTEEIGWRGYLLHKMLPGRNFWDAGWSVGWVWAAWHLPSLLYIFIQQGMNVPQIIGSAAGFTMGIVAMSIFHAWFYERTNSVFFNILLHAAFNVLPLTIVLLYPESPAALASNLLLWAVVFALRKREGITT